MLSISLSTTTPKPGETVRCHFDYSKWAETRMGFNVAISARVDGKLVYSDSMDFPPGGGEWTGYFEFEAPSTPGAHKLVVEADANIGGNIDSETASKTFTVQGAQPPSVSWNVSIDKTSVVPGDMLNIIATISWDAPAPPEFKLGINAFGRSYETSPVTPKTSPFSIKAPLKVPDDVSGTQSIEITLYAYY